MKGNRERNEQISKKSSIGEQYFGLSHLHDGSYQARFTTIVKTVSLREVKNETNEN